MVWTKASVDKHVEEIFEDLEGERERYQQCYSIAKLYYDVAEYKTAQRYACRYLEVRPNSSSGHRLLGEILEARGQKDLAVVLYNISLQFEKHQKNAKREENDVLVEKNDMNASETQSKDNNSSKDNDSLNGSTEVLSSQKLKEICDMLVKNREEATEKVLASIERKKEHKLELKMDDSQWMCTYCLTRNPFIETRCCSCKFTMFEINFNRSSTGLTDPTIFKIPESLWECPRCAIKNKPANLICVACHTANPKSVTTHWACPLCQEDNRLNAPKCTHCGGQKPPAIRLNLKAQILSNVSSSTVGGISGRIQSDNKPQSGNTPLRPPKFRLFPITATKSGATPLLEAPSFCGPAQI